jgi:hypothetical protein
MYENHKFHYICYYYRLSFNQETMNGMKVLYEAFDELIERATYASKIANPRVGMEIWYGRGSVYIPHSTKEKLNTVLRSYLEKLPLGPQGQYAIDVRIQPPICDEVG